MTTQKKRMLGGELYLATDPELGAAYARAQETLADFNATSIAHVGGLTAQLRNLLGHLGPDASIKPTFRCDYGTNIRVSARKEYEDRRRRQAQGIEKARAAGAFHGRPENAERNAAIMKMLRAGQSRSSIVEATGCSRSTLTRLAKRAVATNDVA